MAAGIQVEIDADTDAQAALAEAYSMVIRDIAEHRKNAVERAQRAKVADRSLDLEVAIDAIKALNTVIVELSNYRPE